VNVKIIEVDAERRRLSLSLKRVEDTDPVQPRADGAESVHTRPALDLSEDVFAEAPVSSAEPADVESPFEVPTADEEVVASASAESDATGAGTVPPAEDAAAAEPNAVPAAEPEPPAADEK
jgi:small subunit ribosomal protein S1